LFKTTIKGTVFSGHPSRTTLGNSLRVMLYNLYMMEKAGITKYSLSVGGDDTFILLEKQDLDNFEAVFKLCYSPIPSGNYGLG